jgi:predicted nucleic acid-binding protein
MRARRESFLHEPLANVTVYPYRKGTVMRAGKIDGEEQTQGGVIPFRDLLIGASALALGVLLETATLRHFQKPGLTVVEL